MENLDGSFLVKPSLQYQIKACFLRLTHIKLFLVFLCKRENFSGKY